MGYGDICLFWIEPVEISFTGDILINEFFPFYYYLGFQFLHSKRQTHSLSKIVSDNMITASANTTGTKT